MNQYRCETCTKQACHFHPNNNYWKVTSVILKIVEAIECVGCASHSDFQSERDKVLETVLDIIHEETEQDGIHEGWILAESLKWEIHGQQAGEP
jgi:hypothetical protein